MKLSEWMTKSGVDDDALAALIERSRPTVSRIRRELIRPDWETMDRIRSVTGGQVMPNDYALSGAAK